MPATKTAVVCVYSARFSLKLATVLVCGCSMPKKTKKAEAASKALGKRKAVSSPRN